MNTTTETAILSVRTSIDETSTALQIHYVDVTPNLLVGDIKKELIAKYAAFKNLSIDDIVIKNTSQQKLDNGSELPSGNLSAYPLFFALTVYVKKTPRHIKDGEGLVPFRTKIFSDMTVKSFKREIISHFEEFQHLRVDDLELACSASGRLNNVLTENCRLPRYQPAAFVAYPL